MDTKNMIGFMVAVAVVIAALCAVPALDAEATDGSADEAATTGDFSVSYEGNGVTYTLSLIHI